MDSWWIFPDGIAWGNLCTGGEKDTVSCRAYAHTVLNVRPSESGLVEVSGESEVSYDGGNTWQEGPAPVFETHLVMENTTQVWTLNWDAERDSAASSWVCLKATFRDSSGQTASLDQSCMQLNTTWVNSSSVGDRGGQAVGSSSSDDVAAQLLFGNWTVACSATAGRCRTMGHVAVDGAASGITGPMSGTGVWSVDGGSTWTTAGDLTWLSFFDYDASGTVYQRWHWALDNVSTYDPTDSSTIPSISEICYAIRMTDEQTGLSGDVRMDVTDVPHFSGYASNQTVRCWAVNSVVLLP